MHHFPRPRFIEVPETGGGPGRIHRKESLDSVGGHELLGIRKGGLLTSLGSVASIDGEFRV